MKFLTMLFSLTILTPSMVLASGDGPSNSSIQGSISNKDCVAKVAEYFGVVAEAEKELLGMNNGKKCSLTIKQKKSGALDLRFDTEQDDSELMTKIRSNLSPSVDGDLSRYSISSCDVSKESLRLEYTAKQTYGWKKSFKVELNITGKSITMKESVSGFLTSPYKVKENCNL